MDLTYLNREIDKILWDMLGNDSFKESDLEPLINLISVTVYQYDKRISEEDLKPIIRFLLEHKYQKHYVYDPKSEYNKPENKELNESDTIPLNDMPDHELPEQVKVNSFEDLINHRHDCEGEVYQDNIYSERKKRVVEIKKIPQYEQKSKEWFNQRNECITATAIAVVLDEDPYKHPAELLLDKCGRGIPFEENENVHHGKKYEQIGNMFYSFRNNVTVGEYGLIQHRKYSFIGASPDGICEKNTASNPDKLTKLVGRLLEIKFPKKRRINTKGTLDGDICPHQYYIQCQTQLYVTQLEECDFLQCKMEEYESWNDYIQDSNPNIPGLSKKTNLEKGCLIQLLPKKMIGVADPKMCLYSSKYIYPPKLHMTHEEIEKWISNEVLHFHENELYQGYMIDRIIYWRFTMITCNLITADTVWFESKIPILKQFWDYIVFYRQNPKKMDKLIIFIKEIGIKNTDKIFMKIHKDFMLTHKDSDYQPLYQEKNEWREKYEQKNARYQAYKI